MRTHLQIDDDLYRAVKANAASQRLTITNYVDQALRLQLACGATGMAQKRADRANPISLPTCTVALKLRVLSVDDLDAAEALLNMQEAARLTTAAHTWPLAAKALPNAQA